MLHLHENTTMYPNYPEHGPDITHLWGNESKKWQARTKIIDTNEDFRQMDKDKY